MKTLVVYYSLEGNTEEAANKIAKGLSADVLRLVPEKDIPVKGAKKFVVGGMRALFGCKTKLKDFPLDINQYDRILLGTPIWADRPALAVNTFISKCRNLDRITAVFTCSGVRNNVKCIKYLRKKLPAIKETTALADRANKELAAENDELIQKFIKKVRI